jgi:hypothetical protein
MGKDQTEKSRYHSPYSPGAYVTAVQYIIELICEKRAVSLKKDLPIQFWKNKEWASFFTSQLKLCHGLLKKYDEKAIIAAIQDDEAWNAYSLTAFRLWLKPVLERHEARIKVQKERESKRQTVIDRSTILSKPRQAKATKKSLLDKLKELE